MKFNLLKTLGLAKPLVWLLKDPLVRAVGKPVLQLVVDEAVEAAKPGLKNEAAAAIGKLPSNILTGVLADAIKEDAATAMGTAIDNFKVTL